MKKIAFIILFFALSAQAQWDPFVHEGVFLSHENGEVVLQCEEVRLDAVLQTLANKSHRNLVLTQSLNQLVSMNIRGVSHEKLLDNLLLAYSLQAIERDNILMVVPVTNVPQTRGRVKTYLLNYARAEELAKTLEGRVQTSFDTRTNALMVYNLEEDAQWLDTLIKGIDIPSKQVYIEAIIMNASTQFSKALGLQYHVGEFSITKFPAHIPVQMAIAAAQENHQTNVIANPKLLTMNLQEAHIKQGKQLAYQETAPNGATTVNFQEATLELKVTPLITPEHDIVLNLLVKQDMIGHLIFNGQPTIDTKSLQAQVRVKDGETVVLGGIYSQADHQRKWAVPGLGQLPLIGRLFRENREKDDKDELLIFVTPRVVV